MLAVLYLMLCAAFGTTLVLFLVPDIRRLLVASSNSRSIVSKIPSSIFAVPTGIIVGLVSVSMFHYYTISFLFQSMDSEIQCKRLGTLITFTVFAILTATLGQKVLLRAKATREGKASLIPDFKSNYGSILFYGISIIAFTIIASWLMFWTYRIEDGLLTVGHSTFSDLSPHTAMVSSFSAGFNFPTQYQHFAGDGINYHFFFYFLCGTLQYLGFSIDWAINLPSIITMVCAFTLLGLLAIIIGKRRTAFFIAPILVLFRSSINAFEQYNGLIKSGLNHKEAIEAITHNKEWFGVTPYDTWGIWAINVYPNQRHLMLGVSLILILILLMLPFMRRMSVNLIKSEGAVKKLKTFFISPEAWGWRDKDPLNPMGITILACILVSCMPYFHGSALIGGLLVLAVMAVFSESRLSYLAVAICAVASSVIQTNLFSGGSDNVVSFKRMAGFVCEDKSASGILEYIWKVTFLTLVVAIAFAVIALIRDLIRHKPIYRSLLFICFMAPFIFAFNFQVSLEMLANHKFIQFSIILADAFVAAFLANCFYFPFAKDSNAEPSIFSLRKKSQFVGGQAGKSKSSKSAPKGHNSKAKRDNGQKDSASKEEPKGRIVYTPVKIAIQCVTALVGLALIFPLTATGIAEWHTYYCLNKDGYVVVDTNSQIVQWLEENTETSDVLLTPRWSMNRVLLAGRPLYYGWPYYAWSAGHDTYTRQSVYDWLLTCCQHNPDKFVEYCRERGIKYLIFDNDFYYYYTEVTNEPVAYEDFARNLTQVAYFPDDNNTIVYQIYN